MDMVTYLMAKKHGGGGSSGPVKWEDIQDKPFYGSVTETPLDIQWDGTIGDREIITNPEMGGTGYVRLSDAVLTLENLAESNLTVTVDGNTVTYNGTASEQWFGEMMPGMNMALVEGDMPALCFVTDADAVNAGLAADGATFTLENGVYGLYLGEGVITNLRLWSDTVTIVDETIVPLPTKYLPEIPLSKLPDSVHPVIYTEAVAAEIIPEQELTDTGYGVEPTNWVQEPLAAGYEYAVVFDGTTYNCVSTTNAKMNALYNTETVLIGNASLHPYGTVFSLPNTGEPFLIMAVEDESCGVFTSVKNTAFTIQVSGYYANHHLIPYKYMRKPVTISVALETITSLTGDEKSAVVTELYAAEKALKNGVDVYATYDGEKVQITSMNINESDTMYSYNAIAKNGWQTVFITTSLSGHRMEDSSNALSCGLVTDHIILTSSTSGSTKKFKVTIDDSGQLTPTEIV